MHEGQDRDGGQPPEFMGAWSPIPEEHQPDQAVGSSQPGSATPADEAGPGPAGHDPWVVTDTGQAPEGATAAGTAPPEDSGVPGASPAAQPAGPAPGRQPRRGRQPGPRFGLGPGHGQ